MKVSKEAWIIICLIAVLGIVYFFAGILPKRELEKKHRYTLGIITQIEYPSEGSKAADFYYRYKGQTFHGAFSLLIGYENKFKVGDRIYVKFHPDNPDNSEVMEDIIVSDSIIIPKEGWKEMPLKIR